jgi:hypothetical protein
LEVIGLAAPSTVGTTGGAHRLDVEQRLEELAGAAGPARRVLVGLAGQLVSRRAFERLGYARLSDYARERLGVSARSVQEWARVDRQLSGLPRLEAALVSGRLPWSKVRMLARFVTAEDEAGWIEHAQHVSVRTLERQARAVDRGVLETGGLEGDPEDAEALESVRVRVPSPLAFKWKRTCEYASRVAGERIPPGVALELVTAEVLSGLPVESVSESVESVPESPGPQGGQAVGWEEPTGCGPDGCAPDVCASREVAGDAGPAGVPPFLRPLLHGLQSADAFELDARLRRARRLEQRLDAEIAPLLRHVVGAGHEWRTRFHTLAAYAREHLGMSASKARALLRLERVGDVCPELRAAYRDGAVSWVQAQVLAPLLLWEAEGEWRPLWVRFAQGVSVRELEETVGRALLWREADPARWVACREDPERASAPLDDEPEDDGEALDRQMCAHPTAPTEGRSLRIPASRDVARLFRAVLSTVRRALEREIGRLPSEALAFEAMIDHALRAWGVDDLWLRQRSRKKYAVFERDGWRCTVPGCSGRRNLQAHHVVFRSAGGSDALENQTTLCAFHHLRGVHAGVVRITGRAPDRLWYELGWRPDRPPLVRYRSGDRVAWRFS